ncbi:hypothetical protein BKK81_23580 [Cupriavidus sp. USMAHM13]|nr:hypothetical protein BKK81_23580 [Cupriavidus sp. USMAHM13]
MVIDNQAGAAFRADLNNALAAIATNQSGSVEPNPSFPFQFWADTGNGLLKQRNAANTAWIKLGPLGVANFGLIMPGTVAFHAKSAAPAGWLKCNGGAVSRTTYAELFAEIGTSFGAGDGSTTFNLPELRGEFVRAWDDGRGVDSGRSFASIQLGSVESHRHTFRAAFNGTGTSGSIAQYGANGQAEGPQLSTEITGAGETRPRNIALLACIKY